MMAWPTAWDRGAVVGAIDEAAGVALSMTDTLPDTLIANAQALGLSPIDLRLWIYDLPQHEWTAAELKRWAQRMRLGVYGVDAEGDSTDQIPGRDDGVQEVAQ